MCVDVCFSCVLAGADPGPDRSDIDSFSVLRLEWAPHGEGMPHWPSQLCIRSVGPPHQQLHHSQLATEEHLFQAASAFEKRL